MMNGDRVSGEERLLTDRGARIREVVEGPDGALYLLTDSENGSLLGHTPHLIHFSFTMATALLGFIGITS